MNGTVNAIVGQSGGPTAAINASLAGVIRGVCEAHKIDNIFGMLNGIGGMLEERIVDLSRLGQDEEQLSLLAKTPASYLGSCRFKLPEEYDPIYEKIFEILEKYQIQYFFYIGGNDSMDTVLKLSAFAAKNGKNIQFVGVPKTIDNDLPCTDHTPGFGSAAKYIATVVREISADSSVYNVNSVTIVEIMGRNAGWLTAASALARYRGLGPDLIYVPERTFDFNRFYDDVAQVSKNKKNIVVAVSEGARTNDGRYVCETVSSGNADVFGHRYLGGTARVLEEFVRNKFGFKARGIELNVPQRCAGHLLSKTDISESFEVGRRAVELALEGKTEIMVMIQRISNEPYRSVCAAVEIQKVANLEKKLPDRFINECGNDVTEAFIQYAAPLIAGEVAVTYENGLPNMLVSEEKLLTQASKD